VTAITARKQKERYNEGLKQRQAQLGGRVQGLDIRSNSPGGELIHLKGYCIDHRLLRTGSAKLSRSGETAPG
jgi:hypothetical protein